jgi:hypothetical protein
MRCTSKKYDPKTIERISQNCVNDKKAYRTLRTELHPDKNMDCADEASYKFQEANEICENAERGKFRSYDIEGMQFKTKEEDYRKELNKTREQIKKEEQKKVRELERIKNEERKRKEREEREEQKRKEREEKEKQRIQEELYRLKREKRKSTKVSPNAKPYSPLTKKTKRISCFALKYSQEDVIAIAKKSITDPRSYTDLLEDLSDEYNRDCLELARELTTIAKSTAENLLPTIEYQYYDYECDEKRIDSFSNTAEVAQIGSTKMGSKCLYLTSKIVMNSVPMSGETLIAIISYTKTENRVEIGKAWSHKVEDFWRLMNYLYNIHSSSSIFISCSTFSDFQLEFWSVQMGLTQPYISGKILYLVKGSTSNEHDVKSLRFIKNCITRYEKSMTYKVPNRVLDYLYKIHSELSAKEPDQLVAAISSLVLTNDEFNCKPAVFDIDSALTYRNSSAALFILPAKLNGWAIHAIYSYLFKFLFYRLDFHFVGTIAKEGVYVYRFPDRIRLLLDYLQYKDLLRSFGDILEYSSNQFLGLNTEANPEKVVKYINEKITLRNLLSGPYFENMPGAVILKSYVQSIVSLDQPVVEVGLFRPNAEIVLSSFSN